LRLEIAKKKSAGNVLLQAITLSNVDIGETRPARLTAVEPGPYVRLSVVDNGMGMSPAQAHFFEPFFTTKQATKGTGLGLSTVNRIVQQSPGQIIVESRIKARRSRFSFRENLRSQNPS
jgi:signal transduction histidine kinase